MTIMKTKAKTEQLNNRISVEVKKMVDELVEHFNNHLPLGKVTQREVVELAIRELYRSYIKG
jgi:hypothetical protein